MYNTNIRQYVFRQSSGETWNFFHDEKLGICCSTLTRRNSWTNPVSLHKNAHQFFYAVMDRDDRFHILFQDNQGNIHYSLLTGDSIKSVPVLKSKTPSVYDKHLCLIPIRNNIHFFFVLQHENSFILAHQILADGKLSSPRVVDYVTNSICPCSVLYDRDSNIYAFYQFSDGKYLQLGYKKYNMEQKLWSEITPVTKHAGNCEYPATIIDNNGIIHLCYQRHSSRKYEMAYQQKVPDKNLWTNEVIVHTSVHPFENASILWYNGSIIIYWVRDDIVYYNSGTQSGCSWDKPSRLNFPNSRQLVCIKYGTNNLTENSRVAANCLPGTFAGGLKFAFFRQEPENSENMPARELKEMVLDSIRQLRGEVEELKDADRNMRDEIARLGNAHADLDKEIIKCNVKMNFIETHMGQVKTLAGRLEALENQLKEK